MTTSERATGVPSEDQLSGLGDMDPHEFRAAAHAVVELMADYLETVDARPVLPPIEPGSLRGRFPGSAPEEPEALDAILADYGRLIEPNATHWQHPGFMAYFASTASGAGILGEMLTAALNQNPMLWRTSPIGTELEGVVVDWLRQGVGLPEGFDGLLTDTASTSTLIALAAAREAAGIDASAEGLAARSDVPPLRVYASAEAHSSVEKACMTLGLGRASLVRIPVNERFELRPEALEAALETDRTAGRLPIAIVATVGTTSSTSVDPVAAMAEIAERERTWLHVDAAYAGAVALVPELRAPFEGWERANSIVLNPHKWLFTPVDASLLLTRRIDRLAAAFSLHPEYLRTLDRVAPVRDYTDYTPQLGRRMRALKLWMQPALVRARGDASSHPGSSGACRPTRRGGPGRPRLGGACARPVLDGLSPVAPGALRRTGGGCGGRSRAGRRECRDHRCGEPLGGGVPVAYPPRRPVHDPRRDRQRANAGAPRRTRLGAAPPGRSDRRGDSSPAVSPAPTPHDVIFFASPDELRAWFEEHHASADELWVGYHRKAAGRPTITWPQAVDEALCVGWIDGVRYRLDEERHAQRFTPRRKGSIWSAVNTKRAQELIGRGTHGGGRSGGVRSEVRGADGDLLV